MMLAFSPAPLTFILTWASGMSFLLVRYISFIPSYSPRRLWSEPLRGSSSISGPRSLYDGALFVGQDANEVREARDVEDLHVVLAQVAGQQTAIGGACLCQKTNDQGYPGRVNVIDALEVEEDGLRVVALSLCVGGVESILGEAVDLACQVDHCYARLLAHGRLQVFSGHRCLLPGALPPRWCGGFHRWLRASRRPCS